MGISSLEPKQYEIDMENGGKVPEFFEQNLDYQGVEILHKTFYESHAEGRLDKIKFDTGMPEEAWISAHSEFEGEHWDAGIDGIKHSDPNGKYRSCLKNERIHFQIENQVDPDDTPLRNLLVEEFGSEDGESAYSEIVEVVNADSGELLEETIGTPDPNKILYDQGKWYQCAI